MLVTEKDLYTGLQFKYENIGTLYTLDLNSNNNVTWELNYQIIGTSYTLENICRNINSGAWVIQNREYIHECW